MIPSPYILHTIEISYIISVLSDIKNDLLSETEGFHIDLYMNHRQ